MTVKSGDKVKVDYTGTLDDGKVFDSSTHGDHSHPLEFEVGAKQVIPGFENALIGMKVGEEKTVRLESKDAYGEPQAELVKTLPRKILPADMEPKEGMMIGLGTPDGHQFPATITEVGADTINVDMNHPLAGKALNFKLKLVEIC
jgi:peptidylprolyl isomerase